MFFGESKYLQLHKKMTQICNAEFFQKKLSVASVLAEFT